MSPVRLCLALSAASASIAAGQIAPTPLEPLVVTATRTPQDPSTLPLVTEIFTADTLHDAPALTIDELLRRSAAFSLFRRAGSLSANPTTQGVSLRGIGPSGASRSLVLLDGVPVNDPFGGWVAWSSLPASSLDRVEIVRGGGSAAWGGASLGGVVHLVSAPLLPSPAETRPPPPASDANVTDLMTKSADPRFDSGFASATLGDFGTRSAEVCTTLATVAGHDAFRVEAAAFATDGVRLVRDPGAIDIPAYSEHQRAGLTWAHRVSDPVTLTATTRGWRENRGNGTPYQRNASETLFASATLAGTPIASRVSAWSVTAYAQQQDYRSTFSSIDASRATETPASNQYSVPSTAAGASLQLSFGDASDLAPHADAAPDDSVTTLGLDTRFVDGETREYYLFNGADFTRERRAGGTQGVVGFFATQTRPLAPGLLLNLGARLDATRRADGLRRETTRSTGAVLLDEAYADRDDLAFSPSAGLAWRASDSLTARTAAYSAYRTPTLNELHRPFRAGNVATNANPDLDPETLLGGELGLDHASSDRRRGLRATVFQNQLSDAVANVTLSVTPATVTRQRRNLDSIRVRGLELGGFWQPIPALRLDADYLLSDARVRSGGAGADDLDGKRLAQVPRHTVSLGAAWQAARDLSIDVRARWLSEQFEDDLNTLALAPAARLDLAAHYAFAPRWRITLAVENLLDAKIETARSAAGLIGVAPSRLTRVELGYDW